MSQKSSVKSTPSNVPWLLTAYMIEKLKAKGVKFVSKQVYATPEISGVYAIDPDGQIVELDQFPKPFGEK